MKQRSKARRGVRTSSGEVPNVLRLVPIILLALIATFLLWRGNLSATGGLFQSPGETPTAEPPTVTATESLPTLTPEPTFTPVLTPTEEFPTPTATLAPVVTSTATTEVPLAPTASATEQGPAAAPIASATPAEPTATPTVESEPADQTRYPTEEENLRFNWGELFDSLALGLSYAWLCCGLFLLVSVPALFVALWAAGRRRTAADE